ncbi:MAG TPA: hypothetical protein PLM07_16335 [Candidatus Rifleibacterium sp.]|nr:hypothetical protein [Candidatus Rifleibacterium sp.]HPT47452.1 hypothetical protein [Candidatus Rifleibacterium sp.]
MNTKNGFVLLGLLLFFTVLGISSTLAILQQDTRLQRFDEEDLKLNLDSLRRSIDLFRYHYQHVTPDPTRITALNSAMQAGPEQVADLLISESFIRGRVATGSMHWRIINNLIVNPSFEIDDSSDYGVIGAWRGNYTAGDGVPNGWQLTAEGAEQCLTIGENATFIVSFWAKSLAASGMVKLQIWPAAATTPTLEILARNTEWKRYFGSFAITAAPIVVKVKLIQSGMVSGDTTYIDGLMLEKWAPPAGTPAGALPVASAWTDKYQIVPSQATNALQERLFRSELTPPAGANIASYSWWFQW